MPTKAEEETAIDGREAALFKNVNAVENVKKEDVLEY